MALLGDVVAQLVDRLDADAIPDDSAPGKQTYKTLYGLVARALYRTHVEGRLKSEIIQAPEKFVDLDPDMASTLLVWGQAAFWMHALGISLTWLQSIGVMQRAVMLS